MEGMCDAKYRQFVAVLLRCSLKPDRPSGRDRGACRRPAARA
jgi:hypothetical protein